MTLRADRTPTALLMRWLNTSQTSKFAPISRIHSTSTKNTTLPYAERTSMTLQASIQPHGNKLLTTRYSKIKEQRTCPSSFHKSNSSFAKEPLRTSYNTNSYNSNYAAYPPKSDNGWAPKPPYAQPANTAPPNGAPRVPTKCMFCKSTAHKFSACTSNPLYLHRDPTGAWKDPNGVSVCVNYKGPLPCSRGQTCPFLHACSLCGNGSHSAQSCP